MKIKQALTTLLSLLLVLIVKGCNLPGIAPTVTPTATFTNTPIPATATFTPTDTPTDTPTIPPPTDTPTIVPPTSTNTPTATLIPTKPPVVPVARAKFQGTFTGGTLVFRIGEKGNTVIPKTVALRKATCNQGGTVSDTISFEPPPFYWITDGQFSIIYGDQVSMSGVFLSPTRASGSISIFVKGNKGNCNIGPVNWTAEAVE